MTDREKAIVMAHTGICMLTREKYGVFHAYIEDIMGRPVYTHELATQSISEEIKEKSRNDFIKLCMEEQETCADAISRQAVNTLIDELARAISDERCCISRGRSTATIMRDILHLPPATPQQRIGRWIPVSERLLEKNGYYLTTTMYHEVYCDFWVEDRFNRTEAVIAWMPLPKPYKA